MPIRVITIGVVISIATFIILVNVAINAPVLRHEAVKDGVGMSKQQFEHQFGAPTGIESHILPNGIAEEVMRYSSEWKWQIVYVTCYDGVVVEVTIDR